MWVEERARQDAALFRDAREIWRDLKLAAETAVEQFNKFYCHRDAPEFEFRACDEITEDCFRVLSLPANGAQQRYIEVRYQSERRGIFVSPKCYEMSFGFVAANGTWLASSNIGPLTPDALCKLILDPLLFPTGTREPVNPPLLKAV